MQTTDGNQLNLDALYKICPSCFTESKDKEGNLKRVADWAKLRALLGDNAVEDAPEVYDFTWVGKRAAQREAAKPINKTLRPCPEESVDWDTTQNLYIEGDNLEVLKLLQNSYMGKVKMIYIDPPYNTGNDFVYHDDFAQSAEEYKENDNNEEGKRFRINKGTEGRFHSDWCSMMYSRLMVARSLLSDDGAIFVSIGDEEICNLKKILDEVFGEKNFMVNLLWQSTPGSNTGEGVKTVTENILLYAKNSTYCKFGTIKISNQEKYKNRDEYFDRRGGYVLNKLDRRMTGIHYSDALNYAITLPNGSEIYPGSSYFKLEHWNWRWSKSKVEWGRENGFIVMKETKGIWSIYFKQYENVDNEDNIIERTLSYSNYITVDGCNSARGTKEVLDMFNGKYFDYPKPINLLLHIEKMLLNEDSLILDFFSGSSTTAHALMQLNADDGGNRKFIMVQLQEETAEGSEAYKAGYKNICEIGKERIRRAGKKIKEEHPEEKDLDVGFRVLKCDESNMKDVYFSPKELQQGMLDFMEDNIKEDRSDLDLLFDCMLRWGVELSLPMTTTQVDGCTIHNVNDGDLLACFAGTITDKVISAIAAQHPLRIVFRDSSFTSASQKMNLFEQFKQLLSWSDQEVRNNVKVI